MSQWKSAPTGVDEQATILLQNDKDQMATVALTMHSKQPKRVMISCEKGYIEIMEFPRADKAIITEALTGEKGKYQQGIRQMLCTMSLQIWKQQLIAEMLLL